MLRLAGSLLAALWMLACGSSQQASSPAPEPIANRAPDAGAIDAAPADAGADRAELTSYGVLGSLAPVGDGGVANLLGNAGFDGGVYGLGGLGTSGAWGTIGSGAGGKVVVGAPASPGGSLAKDQIQRVVRSKLPHIRHCYEKRLLTDPALEGRIKVSFTIGADGKIAAASIKMGLHAEVDACVEAVIRTMRFPRPRGGGNVVVNYPFLFETAGDGADAGPPAP